MYIRKDIEFEFIIVYCQNLIHVKLVRLGFVAIMVYRPPSNSGEDNNKSILIYFEFFCCYGVDFDWRF